MPLGELTNDLHLLVFELLSLPGPAIQLDCVDVFAVNARLAPSAHPTPAAVSRKPGVDATASKAQGLDHRFGALARLDSLHRTNSNVISQVRSLLEQSKST